MSDKVEILPLVSVHMISYNQEKYIQDAIEGVLMQQTDFPFELIISDDCSKDSTPAIINEYALKYPDIVKPVIREKNIGSINNFIDTFSHCRGKYIAICEGDDYWTNPLKLQKQASFMEQNPDIALCFHDSEMKFEHSGQPSVLFSEEYSDIYRQSIFTHEDIVKKDWFIGTQTMFFRKDAFRNYSWILNGVYSGDYALQLVLSQYGNVYYLPEVMSVYRINAGGVSQVKNTKALIARSILQQKLFAQNVNEKYRRVVYKKLLIFAYSGIKSRSLKIGFLFRLNCLKEYLIYQLKSCTHYIKFG